MVRARSAVPSRATRSYRAAISPAYGTEVALAAGGGVGGEPEGGTEHCAQARGGQAGIPQAEVGDD
jgi:hypothetical protein